MPRYYFDIHDGISLPDQDGTDLPDLMAARIAAAKLSGRTLDDQAEKFWASTRELRITCRDERGDRFTLVTSVR